MRSVMPTRQRQPPVSLTPIWRIERHAIQRESQRPVLRRIIVKKRLREFVLGLCFFLPMERKLDLERWLRGREEARRLSRAEAVVVSYGKSGRTWLRVLISHYYQVTYGLSNDDLMGFDNMHRRNPSIPAIFFTHDTYLQNYTGNVGSKVDFYDARVILLVRDPRDVAVSQFFQWKYRSTKRKLRLNQYPDPDSDIPLFDFVVDPIRGLPRIIEFMNLWAEETSQIKDLLTIRYEDLHASPVEVFRSIVEFLGAPIEDANIRATVEFASVGNMRKLEERNASGRSRGRLKPGKKGDPNTYKVRRAKVGGYRDYFSDEEVETMDNLVNTTLSPKFSFGRSYPDE